MYLFNREDFEWNIVKTKEKKIVEEENSPQEKNSLCHVVLLEDKEEAIACNSVFFSLSVPIED